MTERDRDIAAVLDEFSPRRHEEQGDWDSVVSDAHSGRRLRRSQPPTWRRRVVLALVVVTALTVVTVVPALAVSKGWFWGFDAPNPTGTAVAVINPNGSMTLLEYMSGDSICYAFAPGSGRITGVCGASALGEATPSDSAATFGLTPGFVFGPATPEVTTVDVELDNGTVVGAETITGTVTNLRAPMRFYIVELPADTTAQRIIGKDEAGQVVGTITIPGS
jgi:hypothetical protein